MTDNEPVEDLARPEPTEADREPGSGRSTPAAPKADASEEAAPRPRRKKRKKRKGAGEAGAEARADGANGANDGNVGAPDGVPGFAAGFPREPELDRLVDAFERGNYGLVRAGATRLAKAGERDEVRRAARELLRRIDPDPLAVVLLLAAIGLLVFLAAWYWAQGQVAS